MTPPRSILVICVRYLGDTLLLRPGLRALKAAFPKARIDVVVAARTGCALDDCGDVSRIIEWPRGILAEAAALVRLGHYDWAIDFTANDRSAVISLATRASLRAAYERPKLPKWSLRRAAYTLRPLHHKKKPHTLIQRMELLEACGVPSQGLEIGLRPRTEALNAATASLAGLPTRILHAHVTSRDMQKAIPVPIVNRVLAHALASGMGVVITAGPSGAERSHVVEAIRGLPRESLRVFHDLDWHGLVATISLCTGYWGCDTAPSHIASALNKKMLIHFGPSQSAHWAPLSPQSTADVLPCACLRQKCNVCPRGVPGQCLEAIDVERILKWL